MTYSIDIFSGNGWTELPTEDRSTLLGTVATPCHRAVSQIRLTFDKKTEVHEFAAEIAEVAVSEGHYSER